MYCIHISISMPKTAVRAVSFSYPSFARNLPISFMNSFGRPLYYSVWAALYHLYGGKKMEIDWHSWIEHFYLTVVFFFFVTRKRESLKKKGQSLITKISFSIRKCMGGGKLLFITAELSRLTPPFAWQKINSFKMYFPCRAIFCPVVKH